MPRVSTTFFAWIITSGLLTKYFKAGDCETGIISLEGFGWVISITKFTIVPSSGLVIVGSGSAVIVLSGLVIVGTGPASLVIRAGYYHHRPGRLSCFWFGCYYRTWLSVVLCLLLWAGYYRAIVPGVGETIVSHGGSMVCTIIICSIPIHQVVVKTVLATSFPVSGGKNL